MESWCIEHLDYENTTLEDWKLSLIEPLPGSQQRVSGKVIEKELEIFQRAQSVLR